MDDCRKCNNPNCCYFGKIRPEALGTRCKWYIAKPYTNADKIRVMTDEQLAAMCAGHTYYQESAWSQPTYGGPDGGVYYTNQEAVDAWAEWLKQPAKED